jgi:hypothetical protein
MNAKRHLAALVVQRVGDEFFSALIQGQGICFLGRQSMIPNWDPLFADTVSASVLEAVAKRDQLCQNRTNIQSKETCL